MPSKIVGAVSLVCLIIILAACTGGNVQDPDRGSLQSGPTPTAAEPAVPARTAAAGEPLLTDAADRPNLIPASELVSNCLNFPEEQITAANSVRLTLGLTEGRPAVDFSLWGSDGNVYSLSELLRTKPVLIVLGGFT